MVDVAVVDLDCQRYCNYSAQDGLNIRAKDKRTKYASIVASQRRQFDAFVVSADGLLHDAANRFLNRLCGHLYQAWSLPYSVVKKYARTRLSIAGARSLSACFRGPRTSPPVPSHCFPSWADGAGLGLYFP